MIILYIFIILLCLFILFVSFRAFKKNEFNMFGFHFFKHILGIIFKIYYPFKKENEKVIPENGPIILAGNHIHLMDQCLPILCTKRGIHYMAKIEYFRNWKVKWFFTLSGCIPVDRENHDENAKSEAMKVLENGLALGIFPEGTRNKTSKTLLDFKKGAVSLAKKTDATIVPYAITGNYKFRTKNLKITFGTPFKVGDMEIDVANKKLYNEILNLIKKNKK